MITDRDIYRFTDGDCHVLARAIHRLTGWTMASIYDPYMDGPNYHAFVLRPDGKALDVEGLHDPDALVSYYGDPESYLMPVQWEALLSYGWPRNAFGDYSRKRARQVAKFLIERYSV